MSTQPTIFSLEEALLNVKDGSRGKYRKCWNDFTSFFPLKKDEFSLGMPCEEDFTSYFKHLREEKKMASSSLWTYYSMLNSVVKGIYGKKLQTEFPRLTSFIKAYDTDIKKKAMCFEPEDIADFVRRDSISNPYWLVRKAVMIVSFFGGLRHLECMSLCLEKVSFKPEGVVITHSRAKQRSDKRESKFLVPRDGEPGFADILEKYFAVLKQEWFVTLHKVTLRQKKNITLLLKLIAIHKY